VRHHSPACARLVADLIQQRKPQVVLIEGPADASHLIPALVDTEVRPPVALMAYFPSGSKAARQLEERRAGERPTMVYPFCAYSPEWVAMREGLAVGARVSFCDLSASAMLLREPETGDEAAHDLPGSPEAGGFRSHEEMWESLIEAFPRESTALMELLLIFGREVASAPNELTLLREQHMWQAVLDAMASGVDPGAVMLICGAAHAARLPASDGVARRLKSPAAEFAITPFTYRHLSLREGYGAGNRTPMFYQRAWEMGGLKPACVATLSQVRTELDEQGWDASTADVIAAMTTAEQLAGLRNKVAPGADELCLAARSVWPVSRIGNVDTVLDTALIGVAAGFVPERIGETPLVTDFFRQARSFWRTIDASERLERLSLTGDRDLRQSRFLHQLRVAGIEFATLRDVDEERGAGASLWTRFEVWTRSWSPATAISLAERSPAGSSVQEVAREALWGQLNRAPGVRQAADCLVDAALAGMDDLLGPSLGAVEAASIAEMPWEDLARATARLARLNMDAALPEAVRVTAADVASRLHDRAALHLRAAACCTLDRAISVSTAIQDLHGAVLSVPALDSKAWWLALRGVAEDLSASPRISGLATSLLYSQDQISPDNLTSVLRFRLSPADGAEDAALFLEGLLSLNRGLLLRSADLAGVFSQFVDGLPDDLFISLLPLLRRTFEGLSSGEMRVFVQALQPSVFPEETPAGTSPAEPRRTAEVLDDARQILYRLVNEGIGRLDEVRADLARAGDELGSQSGNKPDELSGLRGFLADLAGASDGEDATSCLLRAFRSLELLRLERTRAPSASPDHPCAPGLSVLSPLWHASAVGEYRPAGATDLLAIIRESAPESRVERVAAVAQVLGDDLPGAVSGIFSLLAHGDYTSLMVRHMASRPDAGAWIDRCWQHGNPIIHRGALEIAGRLLVGARVDPFADSASTADEMQPAPDSGAYASHGPWNSAMRVLLLALDDQRLWPVAYRWLRQAPEYALSWAEDHCLSPAEVKPQSRDERVLSRLARLLARMPRAIPWLNRCLAGPDVLALDACVSLVRLGASTEEDFRWSLKARSGDGARAAELRWQIECGGMEPARLVDLDAPGEVLASLEPAVLDVLIDHASSQPGPKAAPFVDALGAARCEQAIPLLGPMVASGRPLVGVSASAALGECGSVAGVPFLLARSTARKSDADTAILKALAAIGDLRAVGYIERRLRQVRPEDVLASEIQVLKAIGDPVRLVLPNWLDDAGRTVSAVAEVALHAAAPDDVAEWSARQEPLSRVQRLCALALLPVPQSSSLKQEILQWARQAGVDGALAIVPALGVGSGAAVSMLSEVLAELRNPAVVLPILRSQRAPAWKVSVLAPMGDVALTQLGLALLESEPYVVEAARDVLSALGTPDAMALLTTAHGAGSKKRRR
jgi:hypothetical protein